MLPQIVSEDPVPLHFWTLRAPNVQIARHGLPGGEEAMLVPHGLSKEELKPCCLETWHVEGLGGEGVGRKDEINVDDGFGGEIGD